MKISLGLLEQLQGLAEWSNAKGFVRQTFEDLVAQIKAGWNTNHNADGTHAAVAATSVASTTGYTEHGRSVPLGEWQTLDLTTDDLSSESGSFSFTLTNCVMRYTKIGRTVFLNYTIFNNGVITGTPEFLRIRMPADLRMIRLNDSYDREDRVFSSAASSSQGAAWAYVSIHVADTYLNFERTPTGLWAAAADFEISGQLAWELANA